jgi:hypothetical protein
MTHAAEGVLYRPHISSGLCDGNARICAGLCDGNTRVCAGFAHGLRYIVDCLFGTVEGFGGMGVESGCHPPILGPFPHPPALAAGTPKIGTRSANARAIKRNRMAQLNPYIVEPNPLRELREVRLG